jgi:serine/threonine-protein kinase RsbT
MEEGWSTATDEMRELGFGFGMGLPNIRKNADSFGLRSEVGKGTVVTARISLDAHE